MGIYQACLDTCFILKLLYEEDDMFMFEAYLTSSTVVTMKGISHLSNQSFSFVLLNSNTGLFGYFAQTVFFAYLWTYSRLI